VKTSSKRKGRKMPARKGALIDAAPKFTRTTADDSNKLMNREAAADYLDMSPGTLKNWVSRGLIEYVRIGRHVKFTRAGLDRYIARRTAVPRE